MIPPYCAVCGGCFTNQYIMTGGGGDFVSFADFDDSAARRGYIPGVSGAAWICDAHLPLASDHTNLPMDAAIARLRAIVGCEEVQYYEGLDQPHLFLDRIGPRHARVFAILRAATQMTPKEAKSALENPPVLVAKGWPSEWEPWMRRLENCGASVRIEWD